MKFRASVNGYITGFVIINQQELPVPVLVHYGAAPVLTGRSSFLRRNIFRWQQALFGAPVAITANTTYVVSYFSSSGDYVAANPFFTAAVVNGSLLH